MAIGEMTEGKVRILKAVSTLLENPATKVTINRIAKACHVTDAAIYRHYRSKDEIFTALSSYMEDNLLEPLNEAQLDGTTTYAKIELVFGKHTEFLDSHPGLSRLLIGVGASEVAGLAERLKVLHAKIRSGLAQIFRDKESTGDLVAGMDPEKATELFYGMLMGEAMALAYNFPHIETQFKWQIISNSIITESARGE